MKITKSWVNTTSTTETRENETEDREGHNLPRKCSQAPVLQQNRMQISKYDPNQDNLRNWHGLHGITA